MGFEIAELYSTVRVDGIRASERQLDAFHGRLRAVGGSLDRMADSVARWGVRLGVAAVAGLGVVVKLAADQEAAEQNLAAALAAHGDEVAGNTARLKSRAAEIQRNTIYGDEMILGLMTQARNLGVTADQLDTAARNAIGLSKALGLDLNSALRYGTLALQGEFTMLSRYVPALREAESAAEKMAIVQELMARGYSQATEAAQTSAGRMAQLKNTIGDAAEIIGAGLLPAVADAAAAFKDWLEGDGGQKGLRGLADTLRNVTFAVEHLGPTAEVTMLRLEASIQKFVTSGPGMLLTGVLGVGGVMSREVSEIESDLEKAIKRMGNLMAEQDERRQRGGIDRSIPFGLPTFSRGGITDADIAREFGTGGARGGTGAFGSPESPGDNMGEFYDPAQSAFVRGVEAEIARLEAEIARLEGGPAEPNAQARFQFMGIEQFVRSIQEGISGDKDLPKRQLEEAQKQTEHLERLREELREQKAILS